MTPKEQYTELLAFTKRYLQQEYAHESWVTSDKETFNCFKQYALNQKKEVAKTPVPVPPAPKPAIVAPAKPLPPVAKKVLPQSLPQTKPVEKKTASQTASGYNLESLPPTQIQDLNDWRKIINERFPNLELLDGPPKDDIAKQINSAWQQPKVIPSVIILSFQEAGKEQVFLHNIAKAIQARYTSAAVMSVQEIEYEFGWDFTLQSKNLQLIIANTHGLNGVPALMQHYREVQKHAKFYLSKVPLYLLSDISLYLKEPHLKPALWQEIKGLLS